ncbi:MAG: alpha/beta hydrolase [Myxococcota bacterium]|nr:alpha/beta hydrolase [Myxococcota bacterium]
MRSYSPPPDTQIVHARGLDFAYLQWGTEGPLLLLVHGFPDTARTWDCVGPALAADGYRVVAPYTRGYAPTAVPTDGRYDADTLGDDVISLIDSLGEASAIVVGHDWGAGAAYSAAARHPERIRALVAVAIPHPATVRPRPRFVWAVRHFLTLRLPGAAARFAKDDFAGLRTLYERWSPTYDWPDMELEEARNSFSAPGSLDAALGYYRALSPRPPPGHRERISVPTLIIGGRDDGVVTAADFESSRSRFSGPVEIEMLPGGHFLHREHPEPFVAALRVFLGAPSRWS